MLNANNCTVIISSEWTKIRAEILFAELVSHKFLHVVVSFRLIVLFSNYFLEFESIRVHTGKRVY